MGKKSKKLNNILDGQVSVANEDSAEQDGSNSAKSNKKSKKLLNYSEITDNNSTDGMKSKKKKRKHANADVVNDTSVQAAIEKIIQTADDEPDTSTTLKPKKKKKKCQLSTQPSDTAIENTEIENISKDNDECNIPKKKKKNKGNPSIEDESKHVINQANKQPGENEIEISKKKKNSNLLNAESVAEEKSIEKVDVTEKPKVTKSQKKKKTGTPVLNAEESQVTEEDIDKFCDELDEEDNKQYEDWVKLIEASLPPPRKNT